MNLFLVIIFYFNSLIYISNISIYFKSILLYSKTLSSLFKSINGKNFPFTSLLLTQVNTISSNVLRFVLIEDTPRPTISLTSALKPVPLVPVLSKDVRSPTLYPVPGFNMVIFSTPPLDTDVTSVVCLMVSLDSIIKS